MQQPSLTPKFAKNTSQLQAKPHAGMLFGAAMQAGATAGYLIAYSANATLNAGDVLDPTKIIDAMPVAASAYANLGGNFYGMNGAFGVILLFSTNLDTYTVPTNNAVFMRCAVQ